MIQIELALERNRELVEIDERGRIDAIEFTQDELLALPERHGMNVGAVEATKPLEECAGARSHFEHPSPTGVEQRAQQLDVTGVFVDEPHPY